jgi:asparagine synthase (glutamine-hydrolysing)
VSVEFDEPGFTESHYMQAVASHIGSEHVAVQVSAPDLVGWLPEAFTAMDQPTFDGVNTFAVSRAAAQAGLKVALSGLGADELYDGYGYMRRISLLERMRRLPEPVVRLLPTVAGLFGRRNDKLAYWSSAKSSPGSSYALPLRSIGPAISTTR